MATPTAASKRPILLPQLTSAQQEITLDCPAITNDTSEHALPLFGLNGLQ